MYSSEFYSRRFYRLPLLSDSIVVRIALPFFLRQYLSNALENALYATEQEVEKSIQVQLVERNSTLLIQISNPFTGTVTYENGIPCSSKDNHGFGTKSIATIVDSYNGQYEFVAENHVFTVRVLLPLNNETF